MNIVISSGLIFRSWTHVAESGPHIPPNFAKLPETYLRTLTSICRYLIFTVGSGSAFPVGPTRFRLDFPLFFSNLLVGLKPDIAVQTPHGACAALVPISDYRSMLASSNTELSPVKDDAG